MKVTSPGTVRIQGEEEIVFDGFHFDGEGKVVQPSDVELCALEWLKQLAQTEIDKLKEVQS